MKLYDYFIMGAFCLGCFCPGGFRPVPIYTYIEIIFCLFCEGVMLNTKMKFFVCVEKIVHYLQI